MLEKNRESWERRLGKERRKLKRSKNDTKIRNEAVRKKEGTMNRQRKIQRSKNGTLNKIEIRSKIKKSQKADKVSKKKEEEIKGKKR